MERNRVAVITIVAFREVEGVLAGKIGGIFSEILILPIPFGTAGVTKVESSRGHIDLGGFPGADEEFQDRLAGGCYHLDVIIAVLPFCFDFQMGDVGTIGAAVVFPVEDRTVIWQRQRIVPCRSRARSRMRGPGRGRNRG